MKSAAIAVSLALLGIVAAPRAHAQDIAPESRVAESRPDAPASRRATASFPKGVATTGFLPLELHRRAYPYIRGKVNGIETDLLVDSGASTTAIDSAFARRLELERGDPISMQSASGVREVSYLPAVSIEVGCVTLTLSRAIEIDLASLSSRIGRPIPVILGSELFEELTVDLDYPRSRFALGDASYLGGATPGRAVALQEGSGRRRLMEVQIENEDPALLTFDTGSGNAVELFKFYWGERRLLESRPVTQLRGGGVGGRVVVQTSTLRSINVGGHELRGVPAGFFGDANGGVSADGYSDGNLGADILTRFRVIADYRRERLYLDPAQDWNTRVFRKDRVGLAGPFEVDRVRVAVVAPNSPADRGGWKVGQWIGAVNGRPVTAASWEAAFEQWMTLPEGIELSLTDGDGKVRRLVTADYY